MDLRLEFVRFTRNGEWCHRARIFVDDHVLLEMPGALPTMEDAKAAMLDVAELLSRWRNDQLDEPTLPAGEN